MFANNNSLRRRPLCSPVGHLLYVCEFNNGWCWGCLLDGNMCEVTRHGDSRRFRFRFQFTLDSGTVDSQTKFRPFSETFMSLGIWRVSGYWQLFLSRICSCRTKFDMDTIFKLFPIVIVAIQVLVLVLVRRFEVSPGRYSDRVDCCERRSKQSVSRFDFSLVLRFRTEQPCQLCRWPEMEKAQREPTMSQCFRLKIRHLCGRPACPSSCDMGPSSTPQTVEI